MKNTDIEIQRFYNDIAHQLADDWYCNDSLTPALKSFVSLLKSKPRILDLGCGAGYESMRLHNLGAEVVGIDYAAEPIRIARERNPQCTFEVMDFRKIDNQIGHFDGIAAIASIIHIPNDELAGLFKSMKNILNPNGFIMLVVIEGDGLCKERSIIEVNGFTYNRPFYLHNRKILTQVAEKTGLKFSTEIILADELSKYGWKCFIYRN